MNDDSYFSVTFKDNLENHFNEECTNVTVFSNDCRLISFNQILSNGNIKTLSIINVDEIRSIDTNEKSHPIY